MAFDLFGVVPPGRAARRLMPPRRALAMDLVLAAAATAAVLIAVIRQRQGISIVNVTFGYGFGDMVTRNPGPGWLALACVALTGVPLALRRLYPIAAFCVIFAATMATHNEITTYTVIALVVAAYSAVAYSWHHKLALASVFAAALIITAAFPNTTPPLPGRFTGLLVLGCVAAIGKALRSWRERADSSAERLRRAQAEHAEATRRALALERARIAAELHDVVTHNVSVMVVQAGAARQVLASSPDDARQALLSVEASGRAAMSELRHLLGLLAPDGSGPAAGSGSTAGCGPAAGCGPTAGAALAPQPGLAQLSTLIGRVRGAGVPVELAVSGQEPSLPPGLDLAAYRIVQEALTNVLKHAPGTRAAVRIERQPEQLLIDVTDSGPGGAGGPGLAGGPGGAAGRGLIGLRERVAMYGGSFDAGPRPGGGWKVRASIPLGVTALEEKATPEDAAMRVRPDYQAAPA